MKQIIVLLHCCLPLVASAGDGIKTESEAVKLAQRGLDHLNNGDYAKAFFVSIERAPQYKQVVKGDGYGTRIKELEKACEELPFLHVKTAPRQLVSVVKTGIPFGISPEYKVSFISKAKNGILLQQVILKYMAGKAPKKSYFHTKYRLRFVPNEVRQ